LSINNELFVIKTLIVQEDTKYTFVAGEKTEYPKIVYIKPKNKVEPCNEPAPSSRTKGKIYS
jgi:hypothetical protein